MAGRIRKFTVEFAIAFLLLCGIPCAEAKADVMTDPYEFYQTYGNRTIFVPVSETDGEICFGTAAGIAPSGYAVSFRTEGWQVQVQDMSGRTLDRIHYKRGGDYLKERGREKVVSNIEYNLYTIRLQTILSHLNGEAMLAVRQGKAVMKLNACMVVHKWGVDSGYMDADGTMHGFVYTDYESMCNSFGWPQQAKETFKGYYGKQIENIYRSLSLGKGQGVQSVSGNGQYLYGTRANFYATMERGYEFAYWSKDRSFYENPASFIMNRDYSLVAYGRKKYCKIRFLRNQEEKDTVKAERTYYYGEDKGTFGDRDWKKEGFYLEGWSKEAGSLISAYSVNDAISDDFVIENHAKEVKLYGVWKPNHYRIVYKASDMSTWTTEESVDYSQSLVMKEDAVNSKTGLPIFSWKLYAMGEVFSFEPGQLVTVQELTEKLGIQNENHGTIVLHGQWASVPEIEGQDFYFSLEEARSGILTEEHFSSYVRCKDETDGKISYGIHEKNRFVFLFFQPEKYLDACESTVFTEILYAKNSIGYERELEIKVHLVDTSFRKIETNLRRRIRFVEKDSLFHPSGELKEASEGGLREESCWRKEEEYLKLLKRIFL